MRLQASTQNWDLKNLSRFATKSKDKDEKRVTNTLLKGLVKSPREFNPVLVEDSYKTNKENTQSKYAKFKYTFSPDPQGEKLIPNLRTRLGSLGSASKSPERVDCHSQCKGCTKCKRLAYACKQRRLMHNSMTEGSQNQDVHSGEWEFSTSQLTSYRKIPTGAQSCSRESLDILDIVDLTTQDDFHKYILP